jgi:hypothetical protein
VEHGADTPERETRPDVQAALTVIGRRDREPDARPVDLSRADLTDANLTGANRGANLIGADLTNADLTATDLTRANLTGANLTNAKIHSDQPVPVGWIRDADSDHLKRASSANSG